MKKPDWAYAKKNQERWEQLLFNTTTLRKVESSLGSLHCEYCGQKHLKIYEWWETTGKDAATADHFMAKSKHPDLAKDERNIVVACMKCNGKKGDKDHDLEQVKFPRSQEFLEELKSLDMATKNKRAAELKRLISEWDELAKDNADNKHGLSTSERQDWVDELIELEDGEE